ncbi:hypothetical protein HY498_02375 [Candidatus Woesearchaeota archaeon]|nr:hypothetical protein [Candidatus Woesearchaeota archaeon]
MVIKKRRSKINIRSWLIVILIILAMIVIAVLFLNIVKVPVDVTEITYIKEPVTETIKINYTEPYNVTEEISEPSTQVEYSFCSYKDINFSIEYIGDLSKMAYDYRSNTGYLFNRAIGVNPAGRYVQRAKVCNLDVYDYYLRQHFGLNIDFEVCFFYDNKEVECPNKIFINVLNKPCKETSELDMQWVAPFDPKRDVRLKPISVTQKWTCEDKSKVIPGETRQVTKTLYKTLQKTETKIIYVDKPVEKISTIYITLWEDLRNKYGL